jgi:hypothetical protein
MGSTISVTNDTDFALNVALKQFSPLYYENNLKPGQTMVRNVGKVHFKIEARLYDGIHIYRDGDNVKTIAKIVGAAVIVIPVGIIGGVILFRSAAPTTTLCTVMKGVGNSATSKATTVVRSVVTSFSNDTTDMTRTIEITNVTGQEFHVPLSWCTDSCLSSEVYYMNTDRRFIICGGPTENNRLRPFEVICVS